MSKSGQASSHENKSKTTYRTSFPTPVPVLSSLHDGPSASRTVQILSPSTSNEVSATSPSASTTIGLPTLSLMDKSPSPSAASIPAPILPLAVPPTWSTIQSAHSTSEKNSAEDEGLVKAASIQIEPASRTNSSCSMPDYLCHKFQHTHVSGQSESDGRPRLKPPRSAGAGSSGSSGATGDASNSGTARHAKESCNSPTSTTTTESYQLSDLPRLPAKLATLNKPPTHALIASALRSRKARHSIDVRALPSYLAKKRQSTFGQFLSVLSPTAPEESSSSDDPLFTEPVAPTLSLGERVAWVRSSGPEFGVVKWIGRMPQITNDWTVGVEFDNAIGSGDGTVEGRRYFVAKENFAKFLPLSDLTKVDNYAGRPRSGTMLSRMSVQLKPGQLISIQRSPTTSVPHCYLNAPHHVGHDVHSPNNRHCQCHSCNHPCAHICKTRKPKGKRWTEDMAHMCHFSSKPHAQMCCGGEDLPSAALPIKETGVSWKHSEVISSLRTVPTDPTAHHLHHTHHHHHLSATRKSVTIHTTHTHEQLHLGKKSPHKFDSSPNNFAREQLNSALLERSGSDLSISSLPSSSSVAEIYIGRSVLTDESDIDSETERSLESNRKDGSGSKQGFRSLVACFLSNALRRSDKRDKSPRVHTKRTKKANRDGRDKSHRTKPSRLGLSSSEASYSADVPSSSAPNTQPLNSLSSDILHPQNDATIRPTALYHSSPRFASYNAKNARVPKASPCRVNEFMQQHHIEGHISEEVTNSSSSSAPAKMTSLTREGSEAYDRSRPSTNASSENAPSPRRRRHKGPAPKPPVSQTTQCSSSSPLSTNNASTSCPSSLPQSPSNSSLVTSSSATSARQQVPHLAKSPVPVPPNLTRSLSEQKQLNMKNVINAMTSFRSEVNLQDVEVQPAHRELEQNLNENEENLVLVCNSETLKQQIENREQNKIKEPKKLEPIYQAPQTLKKLLAEEVAPALPSKTFDHVKVFGCQYNPQTKRLESRQNEINRSQSMPFSQYTCCLYHWKEYLAVLSHTCQLPRCNPAKGDIAKKSPIKVSCKAETCYPEQASDSDCECEREVAVSDLMNALLSPKHSLRHRHKHSSIELDSKLATQGLDVSHELLRALSEGSLTNTTSVATVVEFIDDDGSEGIHNNPAQSGTSVSHQELAERSDLNERCLLDVFCQTSFNDLPEKPTRRYKHRQCRCRSARSRNHTRHCRRQCSHHADCCPGPGVLVTAAQQAHNVWLTSSTSDHSLSSLSSSTSTLSETSSMRNPSLLHNNGMMHKPHHLCGTPAAQLTESIFNHQQSKANPSLSKEDPLSDLAGRSPISTERLFQSAENSFPTLVNDTGAEFPFFLDDKSALAHLSQIKSTAQFCEELNQSMFLNSGKVCDKILWPKEVDTENLMSELELAIANGDHQRAAVLAKELAIKRAHCSLVGKLVYNNKDNISFNSPIVAYLYIEDRNTHKGPIPFQVYPSMTVNMLKLKVEKEFSIPSELQRWVLGKNIVTNLNAALYTYGITNSGCPIFLYVICPNGQSKAVGGETTKPNGNLSDDDSVYETLRPSSMSPYPTTTYPSDSSGTVQAPSSDTHCQTLPRRATKADRDNDPSPMMINYIQNPLATLNFEPTCSSVPLPLGENKSFDVPASGDPFSNTKVNLIKNYYYQEGEVPFKSELVFEGLSLVNELLPRVEEEDEEDLEEEEEEDEITAKDLNGAVNVVTSSSNNNATSSTYQKLLELEDAKCVVNSESFECPICFGLIQSGQGVMLRECLHTFCRDCLRSTIEYNEEVQVKCPFRDNAYSCNCVLQDREIKELAASEFYERYLKKSVSVAEKSDEKSFHCKSLDCPGWCFYDDNVNLFDCPVCHHENCINCQAIHENVNCRQYQEELEFDAATNEDALKTKQFLEEMLKREEALRCPQCKVIVMKKWGCDWVKCSMCDTEICWVTKGFRWGPKGKGDTSAGCRCMINGQRCHPNCKYCH